ncbi:MAG: DNA adenine methylase [Gemmatimonadales bacterium]|nr:DNA adenine methylase [Gemmatimonadales bacterium]
MAILRAPFPYFGGKRKVAPIIWRGLGDVASYVEPFAGSAAVLLARPADHVARCETINDSDGMVSNFWRAVRADPAAVAHHADWPVLECDLHARHAWLVGQRESLTKRLEGDPEYHDVRVAGWWVWGACAWIGSGWCSGRGPWFAVDGELVRAGNAGQGISRQLPHLGDAGKGINRKLPHLGNAGQGAFIADWMERLSARLRGVRVASGDWRRVVTPSVLWPTARGGGTVTGVLLDPPYHLDGRTTDIYTHDSPVAEAVTEWARENGDNPALRIALCGYDLTDMPGGWTVYQWKTPGGYGNQADGRGRENAGREVIWFSPHCLLSKAPALSQSRLV